MWFHFYKVEKSAHDNTHYNFLCFHKFGYPEDDSVVAVRVHKGASLMLIMFYDPNAGYKDVLTLWKFD